MGKILLQYQVWIARIGGAFIIDWEGKVVGKAVGIRKWATEDSLDLIEYLLDKKETDSKNQQVSALTIYVNQLTTPEASLILIGNSI